MKVDIIYRCCGKETGTDAKKSARPPWFDKIVCFKSVWNMTDRDPAAFRIHFVYDGPDSPLSDYILKLRMVHDAFKRVNVGGYKSMDFQWQYADALDGDWLYFVEDDYLHAPDAAKVFMEGANRFQLISLYDHLDRYCRDDDVTKDRESLAMTESCHWRTAESTTSTWACNRRLWKSIRGVARQRGPGDRDFFKDLIGLGIRLWTPIPGRSTHCHMGTMSPQVDWKTIALTT
jgi:hypothetical protein